MHNCKQTHKNNIISPTITHIVMLLCGSMNVCVHDIAPYCRSPTLASKRKCCRQLVCLVLSSFEQNTKVHDCKMGDMNSVSTVFFGDQLISIVLQLLPFVELTMAIFLPRQQQLWFLKVLINHENRSESCDVSHC